MKHQNSYSEIQLCFKCQQPLEKARVGSFIGRGVCNECKRKRGVEYYKNNKKLK